MKLVQEFEGVVYPNNIEDDSIFSARLYDITNPPDQEWAEILIDKIPKEELPYIKPGAVFVWKIYCDEEENCKSEIVFNKECWTQEDIDRCNLEAEKFYKMMNPLPKAD